LIATGGSPTSARRPGHVKFDEARSRDPKFETPDVRYDSVNVHQTPLRTAIANSPQPLILPQRSRIKLVIVLRTKPAPAQPSQACHSAAAPFTMINGHKHESERIAHTEEKHHSRIAHTEEKHLPGGWVVLKFGGTSVGKFAENIAGIVK
jgi:hypothetical protein